MDKKKVLFKYSNLLQNENALTLLLCSSNAAQSASLQFIAHIQDVHCGILS